MGMTLCKTLEKAFPVDGWQDNPRQQVCIDVDSQGLLDLYFKTLCQRSQLDNKLNSD
jgi:inosine-uridine nucleoside N-ribohydrolase